MAKHAGALLVIRSLHVGGAERQLVALAAGLKARGREVAVLTLYDGGALAPELARLAIPLLSLQKRGRWDLVGPARRFVRELRGSRPAVIYGFLPTGQLLASLGRAVSRSRVVWGVRSTILDWSHYDWVTTMSYHVAGWLSLTADVIIANSSAGAVQHARAGYAPTRMRVVPNGIDVSRFKFDLEARARLRRSWEVADAVPLVGIVARLDPMKDHRMFLRAAASLRAQDPSARFVVVGEGPAGYRDELLAHAGSLGLDDAVLWLGARDDLPAVYSALDVACSSSAFGEGFSNAVAEAMACQVPCVVTECGDSALIVGSTGRVVPVRDAEGMASAVREILASDRAALGQMARARIEQCFSLEEMVQQTERLMWASEALDPRSSCAVRSLASSPWRSLTQHQGQEPDVTEDQFPRAIQQLDRE